MRVRCSFLLERPGKSRVRLPKISRHETNMATELQRNRVFPSDVFSELGGPDAFNKGIFAN